MNIVPPHFIKSRAVNIFDKDEIEYIRKIAPEIQQLCNDDKRRQSYALAHCQVTDSDPLRFFVKSSGEVIINPIISKHTTIPIDSEECCCSYPESSGVIVKRFNKITVEYYTFELDMLCKVNGGYSGLDARIFQHEIDHFDGIDIYHKEVLE